MNAASDVPPQRAPRASTLSKLVLAISLIAVLLAAAVVLKPGAGFYGLSDHDHDEVMTSRTVVAPTRTLSVLFVGNSLTFVHDVPAMLVNIASSDPGYTTRLAVKAETYPDARLDYMLNQTGALAWAQAHRPDYVVLQEHGLWYTSDDGFDAALRNATAWTAALRPLGATPVLFQVWADGDGQDFYADPANASYGLTPARLAAMSADQTDRLGLQLGVQSVAVGAAFERARTLAGAPDVYGPDHHHASVAGAYLAALVFYRYFTGRSGAEASYRPPGLDAAGAAKLVQASGG